MLTQQYLKELLDYNSDTGAFIRKISRGNSKKGKDNTSGLKGVRYSKQRGRI